MYSFTDLLKDGNFWAWCLVSMCVTIIILVSIVGYWFATGTDSYSIDNKAFQSAKNDCVKLKDYLLIHPDDWHSDEARTIYLVNCK